MEGFNTIKGFSTIEEVLDELRQGKIVLVTDDENRKMRAILSAPPNMQPRKT